MNKHLQICISLSALYLFFWFPILRSAILTWAESRTNFLGGSMCCCTTTGESVIGTISLLRGVTIFWTLKSSIAERAQECPSTRVVIWTTDKQHPKFGNRQGFCTSWRYLPIYYLKLPRQETILDRRNLRENEQILASYSRLLANLQLLLLLWDRDGVFQR